MLLSAISSRARRHADTLQSIRVADSFILLTAQHDFIRPLAQLIQEGLKLLDTPSAPFFGENAKTFQLTLADTASITEEAVVVVESDHNSLGRMHVVETFVAEVFCIIEEAVHALKAFTADGCVKDNLGDSVGSTPSDIILDCENRLSKKFEDLNIVLLSLAPRTNMIDSQPCCHDDGGLATSLRKDQAKYDNVASDELLVGKLSTS